jgi:hypothetical protein
MTFPGKEKAGPVGRIQLLIQSSVAPGRGLPKSDGPLRTGNGSTLFKNNGKITGGSWFQLLGSTPEVLVGIRVLHTFIWALFFSAVLYILYCSIYHIENWLVTLCVLMVVLEGLLLFFNRGICPLTSLAKRYTDNHELGFDIYLPQWLLRRHKLVLGTAFLLALAINLFRNVSF